MGEKRLDPEGRWPDLFDGLDDTQRHAVAAALVDNWHEGWQPNRQDVQNLTDRARGAIDHDEYLRRARHAAKRSTPAGVRR